MRRALLLLLILALAPALLAQKFEQLMDKGDGADLRGKTRKAASRYLAAIEAATTPEQRVEASLALIDVLRGANANADLDAETAAQIDETYKRILTEATGKASFKAHNDYAVFLLDRGDVAAASAIFAEGEKDLDSVPAGTASRYLFNFAWSRAQARQLDDALKAYRASLEKDPAFERAANAVFSVLSEFEPPRAAHEAVSLIDLLIEKGQLAQAETFIRKVMDNEPWHSQSAEMERVLELFVRWAVKSETPLDTIVSEWLPRLKHLGHEFDDDAERKVEQLVLVFEGNDLPLSFHENVGQKFSRWTTEEERRNLSQLLQMAADAAVLAEKPKRAAERYIASWSLNHLNLDALTSFSDLLLNWKDEESDKLLERLITELFEQKGVAIERGDTAGQLRLHMVLGSIFEAREQWGPESNPRTATYQYAAALRNYEMLRQQPNAPTYPGINANLAAAYEHAGEKALAWIQYVAAAEAHLKSDQIDAAQVMLERCDALGYEPGQEEKARMDAVKIAAAAKKEPAPVTDIGIAEQIRDRLSANPDIDATKLDVIVTNGSVVLSGVTNSQQQLDEAKVAVQKTDGVKDVRVQVTLSPPDPLNR